MQHTTQNKTATFLDSPDSIYVIQSWEESNDVNMSEYIIPDNGFQSFNQFFYRQIKPECRPIYEPSNPSVIISPVDGQFTQVFTNLSLHQAYPVNIGIFFFFFVCVLYFYFFLYVFGSFEKSTKKI